MNQEKPTAEIVESIQSAEATEFTKADMKLYESLLTKIEKGFTKASDAYISIGCALWQIYHNEYYRIAHYKNIDDFALHYFELKKSAVHNYINVIERFGEITDGKATGIKDEFKPFKCSQLIRMLNFTDEMITEIKPDWTVQEIIAFGKSYFPGKPEREQLPGPSDKSDAKETTEQDPEEQEPFFNAPEIETGRTHLITCDSLDEILKNRKAYEAAFDDMKHDDNFKKKKIRYELVLVYE